MSLVTMEELNALPTAMQLLKACKDAKAETSLTLTPNDIDLTVPSIRAIYDATMGMADRMEYTKSEMCIRDPQELQISNEYQTRFLVVYAEHWLLLNTFRLAREYQTKPS